MEEFYLNKNDILKPIFIPRYSPDMNPQENIWNYLKAKLLKPSLRGSADELIADTKGFFGELNFDTDKIRSLAYARSFLVQVKT